MKAYNLASRKLNKSTQVNRALITPTRSVVASRSRVAAAPTRQFSTEMRSSSSSRISAAPRMMSQKMQMPNKIFTRNTVSPSSQLRPVSSSKSLIMRPHQISKKAQTKTSLVSAPAHTQQIRLFRPSYKLRGGGFDPSATDPMYVKEVHGSSTDIYQSKLPLYTSIAVAAGTAGFFVPSAMTMPFDVLLSFAAPVHSYLGLNLIIKDYIPNQLQTALRVVTALATVAAVVGLLIATFSGVGVIDAVRSLWWS